MAPKSSNVPTSHYPNGDFRYNLTMFTGVMLEALYSPGDVRNLRPAIHLLDTLCEFGGAADEDIEHIRLHLIEFMYFTDQWDGWQQRHSERDYSNVVFNLRCLINVALPIIKRWSPETLRIYPSLGG